MRHHTINQPLERYFLKTLREKEKKVAFFLFHTMLSQRDIAPFKQYLSSYLQMLSTWTWPKFCCVVKVYLMSDHKFWNVSNQKYLQTTIQYVVRKRRIIYQYDRKIHCRQRTSFSLTVTHATLNPFPHNDTFWRPWETTLLKTLWEKEKLLVTSNFSFSHSVFYPFG